MYFNLAFIQMMALFFFFQNGRKVKKMHSIDQRLEDLQVNFLCCRICLKSSICPSFSQQIRLLLNALLEVRPLQGAPESS